MKRFGDSDTSGLPIKLSYLYIMDYGFQWLCGLKLFALFYIAIRGSLYSKFSFGEVYRGIYDQKFSCMTTRELSQ